MLLVFHIYSGLDTIHEMTTDGRTYELRVDMVNRASGTKGYASYSNFSIADSSDNYRLHVDAFLGGNAGKCSHTKFSMIITLLLLLLCKSTNKNFLTVLSALLQFQIG